LDTPYIRRIRPAYKSNWYYFVWNFSTHMREDAVSFNRKELAWIVCLGWNLIHFSRLIARYLLLTFEKFALVNRSKYKNLDHATISQSERLGTFNKNRIDSKAEWNSISWIFFFTNEGETLDLLDIDIFTIFVWGRKK